MKARQIDFELRYKKRKNRKNTAKVDSYTLKDILKDIA